MARPSKEQWLDARQRWEADPTETFVSVGQVIGVSHTAVMKAAKREGWVRSSSLTSINRAAQIKADSSAIVAAQVAGETEKKPLPSSIEASTDLRAKLIHSHRAEWRKHAAMFPLDAIKADFNEGKSAKISAEMLAIRQKAERIAWGMDSEAADTSIVINNPRRFD